MRIFVTGACGFAGRHLARDLRAAGHSVVAFDARAPGGAAPEFDGFHAGDIRDRAALEAAVAQARPEACVHLCALTFVPDGWRDPDAMVSVNVQGTLALLEVFRRQAPDARLLVVSSAEVYGRRPRPGPVREDDGLAPDNPYAISKAAADLMALAFAAQAGARAMTVRPGNHIGPGQRGPFAVASFAAQLAAVRRGEAPPVLRVGNLDARRDFTDVRDVVRAYRLLAERGAPGRAYNVGSHRPVRIGAVLDQLCAIAGVRPALEQDPARVRPAMDRPALDTARIEADVGWTPRIPLPETLRDIMADALGGPEPGSTR